MTKTEACSWKNKLSANSSTISPEMGIVTLCIIEIWLSGKMHKGRGNAIHIKIRDTSVALYGEDSKQLK